MNNTKIVIICLLLVIAIFFIGLSLNLIEKPNHGLSNESKERQREVVSEYKKDSWIKVVDGLLSPFADSLKPEEVSIDCLHTKSGITLNQHTSACAITVPGFSETFKKLSLKPDNPAARLTISYKPFDEEAKPDEKWPFKESGTDNINFVILGNEDRIGKTVVTISIRCDNCLDQRRVNIVFE